MPAANASVSSFVRDPDLPFLESRDSRIQGRPFGRHTHETYSVAVVEEGSTVMECRGGRWPVGPGQLVFLPPGEPHACNPLPGGGLKYRKFYFDPHWLRPRLAAGAVPGGLAPSCPAVVDDAGAARAVVRFALAPDAGEAPQARLALLEQALKLLLGSGRAAVIRGESPGAARPEALDAARLIAQDPARDTLLSETARAVGVSPCHLPRIFRRTLGVTPAAYRAQKRVELAKRLLASGASIAQAAAEAGFADQSHLNRVFMRHAGATPGQYRSVRRGRAGPTQMDAPPFSE